MWTRPLVQVERGAEADRYGHGPVRLACEHTFDGRGRAAHARRRGPPARALVHAPRTRRPERGGRLPLRASQRPLGPRPPARRRGGAGRSAVGVALRERGRALRVGRGRAAPRRPARAGRVRRLRSRDHRHAGRRVAHRRARSRPHERVLRGGPDAAAGRPGLPGARPDHADHRHRHPSRPRPSASGAGARRVPALQLRRGARGPQRPLRYRVRRRRPGSPSAPGWRRR